MQNEEMRYLKNEKVDKAYQECNLPLGDPHESIKCKRHVFNSSLSKEWEKWEQENPLPEKAAEALKKYPKPPQKKRVVPGSKLFSEKSFSIKPEESQNNINIINSKRQNARKMNSSNFSDQNVNATDSAGVKINTNKKDDSKKDKPKKYFLFHKRPSGNQTHLFHQKPTSVHFDINALEHEEESFLEPSLAVGLDKFEKLAKSRARIVHCNFTSDEETDIFPTKRNTLYSSEINKDSPQIKHEGAEKVSNEKVQKNLDSHINKVRQILIRNKSDSKLSCTRLKHRSKKTNKKKKIHKNKSHENKNLNSNSSKTVLESNKPWIREYKHPDNKSFIFMPNKEPEASVCCIPWVKDKMKRIEMEKKKAKKQVQKLFPIDKGHFLHTDISNPNLVRNITSICDQIHLVNSFMRNYL